jgi:hypothetical protein
MTPRLALYVALAAIAAIAADWFLTQGACNFIPRALVS